MNIYRLALSVLLMLAMGGWRIALGTMIELAVGYLRLKREW